MPATRPPSGAPNVILIVLESTRADALGRRAERAERAQHVAVDLARVRLAADDGGAGEAGFAGDERVELLDLVVGAVEDLEEGGLGAAVDE